MRIVLVSLLFLLPLTLWGQEVEIVEENVDEEGLAISGTQAHLRGLDTIIGSTQDFEVDVGGSPSRFGRLLVEVSSCRYFAENPSTHSYGFITVKENPELPPIFNAWMIASAPALSAMDHPRYDIWLITCSGGEKPVGEGKIEGEG